VNTALRAAARFSICLLMLNSPYTGTCCPAAYATYTKQYHPTSISLTDDHLYHSALPGRFAAGRTCTAPLRGARPLPRYAASMVWLPRFFLPAPGRNVGTPASPRIPRRQSGGPSASHTTPPSGLEQTRLARIISSHNTPFKDIIWTIVCCLTFYAILLPFGLFCLTLTCIVSFVDMVRTVPLVHG